MNDKTRAQIEAMKKQTIGVEIEMNNITREKAARKVAEYFGTRAWNAASEYGYYSWACKDQQGKLEIPAGCEYQQIRMQKNANWSPQSSPTRTSKPCRTSSDCSARQEQRAAQAADAEYIFTSARATTPQRPCGIWSTSWQRMSGRLAEPSASMQDALDTTARWSTTASWNG